MPEQQRIRLLSVRAYDADGIMRDAEVAPGAELEAMVGRFFRRPGVAYTARPQRPAGMLLLPRRSGLRRCARPTGR